MTDRLLRLYIVRHGQVEGYDKFPIYGRSDVDLTEVGKGQMVHLAERLQLTPITAIYSSRLQRTVKGAQIIARFHDVPLYALPELNEMDFGDWEGLSLSDVRDRYPEELKRRQEDLIHYGAPGGGESITRLSDRVMACFHGIMHEQKGDEILLIGHGAVNRVILCKALGLDLSRMFNLHQDYGCLNIIDYFPDSTLVRLVNG